VEEELNKMAATAAIDPDLAVIGERGGEQELVICGLMADISKNYSM
jgi:hypothetical protein